MKYYDRNDVLARGKSGIILFYVKIIRNLVNSSTGGFEYYMLAYIV